MKASTIRAPRPQGPRKKRAYQERRRQAGRSLAEEGARRAEARASRTSPGWGARAYAFALDFARHAPARFTSEDVRAAAGSTVAQPPDARAWGAIFMRLQRDGHLRRVGFGTSANPVARMRPINVWEYAR